MIGFGSITISTINAVEETQIYYYQSSSAEDLIGGSWSTTRPTWEDGKYVWQKTKTIYKDGTSSESQPVNITGQQGVGVSSVQRYYKMTDSLPAQPTDATISSWSTTEPQYVAGSTDNIYTVEKIVYADGTTSYSDVSLSASFIAAKQAYELANGVNDKVTSVYGTCSTLASTAKKEVECAGFELYQGARIQVSFNYGNSASTPTLDVNNTGEKNIYLINTIIDSSNQLYWTANVKIDFVYNGTGWVLQNIPVGLYGVCNSNSDTVAKEVICGEAVICKGTYLSVLMNNNNTATAPTLNVASTVACAIKANNSTLTSDSIYNWRANFIQNFIFDGQYWVMCDDIAKYDSNEAKKEATNYLSIDNTGIMVADMSAGQRYLPSNVPTGIKNTFIDNDSFDIRDGQTVLASFGKTVQIGKSDVSHAELDFHSFKLIDKEDTTYFFVSDLRDESGVAEIVDNYIAKSDQSIYQLSAKAVNTDYTVEVSDSSGTVSDKTVSTITFNPIPNEGAIITITYLTTQAEAKAFTMGSRLANSKIGLFSFATGNKVTASGNVASYAEGYQTIASGNYGTHAEGCYSVASGTDGAHAEGFFTKATNYASHAEGNKTEANGESSHAEGSFSIANNIASHAEGGASIASGECSHAEGWVSTASGDGSHAEGNHTEASGDWSHAEGNYTEASGNWSHAEGFATKASGKCSHASGLYTKALSENQTVIGSCNIGDSQNKYSFIIGNGSHTNNTEVRSNALAITWDGDTEFALDTTASSGTIDANLYDAITALGWNINDITV